MKVSAIVSVYKAASHITNRIDNLLDTDLSYEGELEIVIVNAGNKQDEHDLIVPYLKHPSVKYIRSLREPIYSSWNRGIQLATGTYVTNANCDDWLFRSSLTKLADMLDAEPDLGVVYPDFIACERIASVEDFDPAESGVYAGDFSWPEFDPVLFTRLCFTGPMPMWRRDLHAEYGMFDEGFQLAGDYEFFLRLAAYGVQFKHAPFKAGLFSQGGTGTNNAALSGHEARRAILSWKDSIHERFDDSRQS